jgi:hypothetical protein
MAELKAMDLTGKQIGKWSVGKSIRHKIHGYKMYTCTCKCGTVKDVKHSHLASNKTHSCGCSWTKHGMARSNEYRVWDSMIRRCHSETHKAYKNYGARGIEVCDKWRKFDGFFEDMGIQPKNMTLERINNELGYSKDNCKWATVTEQARNRRSTKLNIDQVKTIKEMIANGFTQKNIAECFGVSRGNIGHIAQNATWRV